MHVLTWAANHRLLAMGLGVGVLVVLALVGFWFFVFRSPATPVDLTQALRLYRQGQRPGGDDPRLPSSGVYRYRTTGSEHLSVGGISRAFPSETEQIVTDARCATMRWEPFAQHVEGLVVCPAPGGALVTTSAPTYEKIAGTEDTTDIRCPADAYLVPPDRTAGTSWTTACAAAGTTVAYRGEVVGASTVVVGGTDVPALHVRIAMDFSGAESGTSPVDYWVSPASGLVLRQRETVDLDQPAGPLGTVRYSETMTLDLDSTVPAR